jgi:hypothetical protein
MSPRLVKNFVASPVGTRFGQSCDNVYGREVSKRSDPSICALCKLRNATGTERFDIAAGRDMRHRSAEHRGEIDDSAVSSFYTRDK